jgi:hypothetical protein
VPGYRCRSTTPSPTAPSTLRLGRAPAVDPAKRKGVLLLLPGGPGPGIAEMMAGDERKVQHVADFQQQFCWGAPDVET